jgi:hypothetical protein
MDALAINKFVEVLRSLDSRVAKTAEAIAIATPTIGELIRKMNLDVCDFGNLECTEIENEFGTVAIFFKQNTNQLEIERIERKYWYDGEDECLEIDYEEDLYESF